MGSRPFFVDVDLNQNEMQFAVLHTLGTPPSSGTEVEGQLYYDTGSQTPFFWNGSSWTSMSSATASSVPFSGITTQTNTSATMTVGSGAVITFSGSGLVNANQLDGLDVDAAAATDGQVLVYQGGSIDAWQAVDSDTLGADLSQAVILNPETNTRNLIQANSGFTGLTVRSGTTGGGVQNIFVLETDGGSPLFTAENNFGDYNVEFSSNIDSLSSDTNFRIRSGNTLSLFNSGNSFSTNLAAAIGLSGTWTLFLPGDGGSEGQYLRTAGSGLTSWDFLTTEDIIDIDTSSLADGDILQWFGGSVDAWLPVPTSAISADLGEAVILSPNTVLRNLITPTDSGAIGLSIRAHPSQAVDLFVVESPIGTDYFQVTSAGNVDIDIGNLTVTAGDLTVTAGDAVVGGTIRGGGSAGTAASVAFILDNAGLGGGPRTMTFPNASGTLLNTAEVSQSTGEVAVAVTSEVGRVEFRLLTNADISDFDEAVDDRVAVLIQDGTGLAWTYVDGSDTLTGNVSLSPFSTDDLSEGSALYYTDERVDDRVSALIQDGTGITWSYDDGANTLTPTVSISGFVLDNLFDVVITSPADNEVLAYNLATSQWINQTAAEANLALATHTHVATDVTDFDEAVDDRVSNLVQNGIGLTWTYVDGSNTFTGDVTLSPFSTDDLSEGSALYYTDERVDDRVAALIQDGTGITWTYDDGANTLTANVSVASYDLGDLNDVVITSIGLNEVIQWTGLNWANRTLAEAGIAAAVHTHVSTDITDFDEAVDDRAAALIQDGTGLTWTYVDGSDTLTGNVSLAPFSTDDLSEGSALYYTDERVDDRVAALIQDGTGITWSYDDGANTLTPTVSVGSFNLADLADVVITSPADNEVLAYDNSSGDWINQTPTEAGLIEGAGVANQVARFSGTSTVIGDNDFTFDGTDVRINNELRMTSLDGIKIGDDSAVSASAAIDILVDNNAPYNILMQNYYSGAVDGSELRFFRARNQQSSPQALTDNDQIGNITFYGQNTTGTSLECGIIRCRAGENFSGAAAGVAFEFWTIPYASPSSAQLRLTIDSDAISSTEPFRGPNGSSGTPQYSFTLDDDTGMYRSADGEVGISGNGTTVVTFNGDSALSAFTGDVTVSNDVTIGGNLLVQGSTTTINTTNLIVEDNFIIVNSMGVVQDAGIEVERGNTGSGDNAFLRYSENVNEWFVDNGSVSHLIARKHAEEITGNGLSTSFDIDHNMGTLYVAVQVFDSSTGKQVEVDVDVINTTRVTLEFNIAPSGLDSYRVIVVG